MKFVILICACLTYVWAGPLAQVKPVSVQKHQGGRIVGGDVARQGQFPYEVAVYFDTPDGTYFCGGAMIDPRWVLTAGHCVYHATVFTLHLGANSLVDDDPYRVTIGASYSVVHPDYSPDALNNDIGLVRIDTVYDSNPYIQTIPFSASPLAANVNVTVSGWGASGDWDGVVNELNFVTLNTISNADCRSIYGEVVTDDMVCAVGPTNEGTCTGDSGSPLVAYDPQGRPYHVGTVSWISDSGCETDHPSGYTRTGSYADWILSVIES